MGAPRMRAARQRRARPARPSEARSARPGSSVRDHENGLAGPESHWRCGHRAPARRLRHESEKPGDSTTGLAGLSGGIFGRLRPRLRRRPSGRRGDGVSQGRGAIRERRRISPGLGDRPQCLLRGREAAPEDVRARPGASLLRKMSGRLRARPVGAPSPSKKRRGSAPSQGRRDVSGRLGFAGVECLLDIARRFRRGPIAESPAIDGRECMPRAEAGVL